MFYKSEDDKQILDGIAGLWCCNAGHCHPHIVKAVQDQIATMDYATAFNMSHPKAFQLAEKISEITPKGLDRIFFGNSGSEAVDTALKVAVAYHVSRGEGPENKVYKQRERLSRCKCRRFFCRGYSNKQKIFRRIAFRNRSLTAYMES